MRQALALAAAVALAAAPLPAAAGNRYYDAAMRLYADMEYEKALENFLKGKAQGNLTEEEDVEASLRMGLIYFELGNTNDAESSFKEALALKIDVQLPKGVSPKVVPLFEKDRAEIQRRIKDKPAAKVAPRSADPVVPFEKPTPGGQVEKGAGSGTRTIGLAVGIPLMALGLGLAGGGGYFGWASSKSVDDARSATFQSEAAASLENARSQATNANILYGVGAAVAVAGVITLIATIASSPGGDAPTTVDAEMPGR